MQQYMEHYRHLCRGQDTLALHEGFDNLDLQVINAVPVIRLEVRRRLQNIVADSQQTMESLLFSWCVGKQAPKDVVSSGLDQLDPVVTVQSPRMSKHLHEHEGRYGVMQ